MPRHGTLCSKLHHSPELGMQVGTGWKSQGRVPPHPLGRLGHFSSSNSSLSPQGLRAVGGGDVLWVRGWLQSQGWAVLGCLWLGQRQCSLSWSPTVSPGRAGSSPARVPEPGALECSSAGSKADPALLSSSGLSMCFFCLASSSLQGYSSGPGCKEKCNSGVAAPSSWMALAAKS